jgi:hypothetical protein
MALEWKTRQNRGRPIVADGQTTTTTTNNPDFMAAARTADGDDDVDDDTETPPGLLLDNVHGLIVLSGPLDLEIAPCVSRQRAEAVSCSFLHHDRTPSIRSLFGAPPNSDFDRNKTGASFSSASRKMHFSSNSMSPSFQVFLMIVLATSAVGSSTCYPLVVH